MTDDAVDALELVDVADLPYAHNPFRCTHASKFTDPGDTASDEERAAAGRRFYAGLSAADFAACDYHRADWPMIAAAAADVAAEGPADGLDDLIRKIGSRSLPDGDGLWLLALLGDPIVWRPGAPTLTNGQHRVCALRAAGVAACPVDTGGRYASWRAGSRRRDLGA